MGLLLNHARHCVGSLLAVSMLYAGAAEAQTPPYRSPLPDTYEAAMKCLVANGRARTVRQRAGDATAAAHYEAGARSSFEAAQVVAGALGYSERRFSADLDRVREHELPLMVNDAAYFRVAVATCRGLGLMPTA